MKNSKKVLSAVAFLILAAALDGCMAGKQLYHVGSRTCSVTGTYTLLALWVPLPDDVQNLAILVSDSSKYPVEIYDIDTSYKVEKEVPAQQALSVQPTLSSGALPTASGKRCCVGSPMIAEGQSATKCGPCISPLNSVSPMSC